MRVSLQYAVFGLLASLGLGSMQAHRLPIRHTLDESARYAAIAFGEDIDNKSPGLRLGAAGQNNAPMRDDTNRSNSFIQATGDSMRTTGFGVELFTPYTWLARGARRAVSDGASLSADELDEAYSAEVLRVIGYPDTPASATPGIYGDRVETIAIRATPKKNYEELVPTETKRISDLVRTMSGVILDMGPLVAAFPLDEVQRVSSVDKKGEFFVVIVSESGKEKKFKIKTKHFKHLP